MAFVPEGQAHSKPGTKCLGIDVKRLRPGGTVEVIVSPSVSRIGSIVPLDGMVLSGCRIRGNLTYENIHLEGGTHRRCSRTKEQQQSGESKANPRGGGRAPQRVSSRP